MIDRLREPGGTLGTLTVASFFLLAIAGAAGIVLMVVALTTDADIWSDATSDVLTALVLFLVSLAGAGGFLLMERSAWGGAALAVAGGLAFALVMFWTIVTALLGLGVVAVAVARARAMHAHTHPTAAPA